MKRKNLKIIMEGDCTTFVLSHLGTKENEYAPNGVLLDHLLTSFTKLTRPIPSEPALIVYGGKLNPRHYGFVRDRTVISKFAAGPVYIHEEADVPQHWKTDGWEYYQLPEDHIEAVNQLFNL